MDFAAYMTDLSDLSINLMKILSLNQVVWVWVRVGRGGRSPI